MNATTALADPARHRLLALIGVTEYVLRGPRETRASRPSAADPAAVSGAAHGAEAVLLCDAREAGADPSQGRYAALLKQICAAFGARGARVATSAAEGCAVAFGAAPPDAAGVVLAPPLATVRESARAKRAVWRQLRGLLRGGR